MYEMTAPPMYKLTAGQASLDQANPELIRLIERARSDPAAFRPLYQEFFPRVYRYCLKRVNAVQEAEDLTSQIFTRALSSLGTFRGGSFPAWLFRIAHNAVINHVSRRRVTVPLDALEATGQDDDTLGRLIDAEERQHATRLMAALPDEERNLLALKIAGGLSAREIGQVVGKNEGAVRVALFRIVQQLRRDWQEEKI